MSRTIFTLCLSFLVKCSFAQVSIELFYDQDAIFPDNYSTGVLEYNVNRLYEADTIRVVLQVNASVRRSSDIDRLLSSRESKLRQWFIEEGFRPVYLSFNRVESVVRANAPDVVINVSHFYELDEDMSFLNDTVVINDQGWRVQCKIDVPSLAKQIVVERVDVYQFLEQENVHAVLNGFAQLDMQGMYKITMPDGFPANRRTIIQIPVDERLASNSLLVTPMGNGFHRYLKKKSLAKSKVVNNQFFLQVPVFQSCMVAVAQIAPRTNPVLFAVPSDCVLLSAEMRTKQPNNFTRAVIFDDEATAWFESVAVSQVVEFRFNIEYLDGSQANTTWISMEQLKKLCDSPSHPTDKNIEVLLLNSAVFSETLKLACHE